MIPLFLGLSAANMILLAFAFGLGLFATDAAGRPTHHYPFHVTMGIAAGLMTCLTHLAVYTYFMATSKWLQAATDKANLGLNRFVTPTIGHKGRCLRASLGAIIVTMVTMFAGAASDPVTPQPWWSGRVHLVMALGALGVNMAAATIQFDLVRNQGRLMDEALGILNQSA